MSKKKIEPYYRLAESSNIATDVPYGVGWTHRPLSKGFIFGGTLKKICAILQVHLAKIIQINTSSSYDHLFLV